MKTAIETLETDHFRVDAPMIDDHEPTVVDMDYEAWYDARSPAEMADGLREDLAALEGKHGSQEVINLVFHTYLISRAIGDRIIAQNADSEGMALLADTRYDAQPVSVDIIPNAKMMPGASATFDTGLESRLLLGQDALNAKASAELMGEAGVTLIQESDAQLFNVVLLVGHESGHALLNGISIRMAQTYGTDVESYAASKLFLERNPGQAFNGDERSDVLIQEERFAEGYGLAVVHELARSLGYSDEDCQKIKNVFKSDADLGGFYGKNQVDRLSRKSTNGRPLYEESEKLSADSRKYPGSLGYSIPLDDKELALEINDLAVGLESEQPDVITDWHGHVQATERDRNVTEHITRLKRERAKSLTMRLVQKVGAATIGVAVASSAFSNAVTSDVRHPEIDILKEHQSFAPGPGPQLELPPLTPDMGHAKSELPDDEESADE